MGNNADGLDILLLAETGNDNAAKPSLAEAARIGADPMHEFDHDFWQSAEAVMPALDRCGQWCLLSTAAQLA